MVSRPKVEIERARVHGMDGYRVWLLHADGTRREAPTALARTRREADYLRHVIGRAYYYGRDDEAADFVHDAAAGG